MLGQGCEDAALAAIRYGEPQYTSLWQTFVQSATMNREVFGCP